MRKLFLLSFSLSFVILTLNSAFANVKWERTTLKDAIKSTEKTPLIDAPEGKIFKIDFEEIAKEINHNGEGLIIELPGYNDVLHRFELRNNTTMSSGLKNKYPEIQAFDIVSIENQSTWGKLDLSPKGVFVVFQSPGRESIFIDPLFQDDLNYYILYTRSQYISSKEFTCNFTGSTLPPVKPHEAVSQSYNSCELRTFRIAVAATGEYSQFHGGTVQLAMAAIVTTINRVNMIYERDLAVTLELVSNNNQLVFLNGATDPYTNGNPGAMISQNGQAINMRIGSSSYDIGHVFGTNSGGLAGLGVVCSNRKAEGVTGSSAPIGDAFDIDYVAHEIGHQFGANHTFNNSCSSNRNNSTAMEPGSGSTIMAYAGICNPNIQFNSDDYFHGISLQEIGLKLSNYQCGTIATLDNVAPVIESVPQDVYVPISTPFALTAVATDENENDVLTYTWEQMNNQISTQPPVASSYSGPNFRTFAPDTLPTRYFPRLVALANSPGQTWERLPAVERTMNFRVTVRDNAPGGGCTQHENIPVKFVESAGPFNVTYPNAFGITWQAYTEETITWDVANTTQAPISCDLVDIYLSIDGGKTYPVVIEENVPNTGSKTIEVPNYSTSQARIMVMNSNGTFFDISYNNFTINGIENGFYFKTPSATKNQCAGGNSSFIINAHGVGNFDAPITLSVNEELEDITASFNPQILFPGQTSIVTFSTSGNIEIGSYTFTIIGNSGDTINTTIPLTVEVNAVQEGEPQLVYPENEALYVEADVEFKWIASNSPNANYKLQVTEDPEFVNVLYDIEDITENSFTIMGLDAETNYYWRVKSYTNCDESDFSETFEFFTHTCFEFVSADVPVSIPSFVSVQTSEIEITSSGVITDVNIPKISGTHGRISDLTFELISPQGTSVILTKNICNSDIDFDFGFDDAAAYNEIDCPPTTGNIYTPDNNLSAFNGEDAQGIWTLKISDDVNGGAGSLEYWELQICVAGGSSYLLTTENQQFEMCQNSSYSFEIETASVFGFDEEITLAALSLPPGASVSFNPQVVQPGETTTVNIQTELINPGVFDWIVKGQAGSIEFDLPIQLIANEENPQSINPVAPQNNSDATSAIVYFEWEPSQSPSAIYTIELAYDNEFDELINSQNTGMATHYETELPPASTVYWRVKTQNGCGESISQIYTIHSAPCDLHQTSDLPKTILSIPVVLTSEIEVLYAGEILAIAVKNIAGTHLRVSDLSAKLMSPEGTTVQLFSEICDNSQDFNFSFSDEGLEEIDCPPTSGQIYKPQESLAAFIGENAQGTWKLLLEDHISGAGGSFQSWALEICFEENVFGLYETNAYQLNIYPNPTAGKVVIDNESTNSIQEVSLLDVSGRSLKQIKTVQQKNIILDLTSYASGIYFIRASGAEGNATYKIIKTN